jgi:hypothetical protein
MRRDTSIAAPAYIEREWDFSGSPGSDALAIADLVYRWAREGDWLDLGCGPMLPVWPMFTARELSVFGIDRIPDLKDFYDKLGASALGYTRSFRKAERFAHEFRAQHGIKPRSESLGENIREFRIASVLDPFPDWAGKFATVLQVGCFGCLDSIEQLKVGLQRVYEYLDTNGVFISATWVPHRDYYESRTWGGDNLRMLSCGEFATHMSQTGFEILFQEKYALESKNYSERFVIVASRR